MKMKNLFNLLVFLLVLFSCNSDEQRWTTLTDDEFGYSIDFPYFKDKEATKKETVFEDTEYGDIISKGYTLNCQNAGHDNLGYSIVASTIPEDSININNSKDVRRYFDNVEFYMADITESECISRKVIEIHSYPGREFWFRNDYNKLKIKVHSVLINNIEIRYFVVMKADNFLNPSINKYMNSFNLNNNAQH